MNCCRWFEKADVSNQSSMCKTIFYEILVNVCKFDQGSVAMTTRRSSFQTTCLSFLERSSKNFLSCSSRLGGSSPFGGGTIGLHRPFWWLSFFCKLNWQLFDVCFWNVFRFVCECFLLCRLVTNAFGFKLLSRFESETCFVWDFVYVNFSAVRVIWDHISVSVWRCWTVGKCFLLFLFFWRCETTWQVSHVLLEMFLSVWSEKLVFTGQQTVIFLRLANSSFSSRFKIFTLLPN